MSTYRLNNTDIRSLPVVPPAFFAQIVATGAPGAGGTGISAALQGVGITLSNYLPLTEGIVIKNMGITSSTFLRVYENIGYTGQNRYFTIGGLDEMFIGCTNPGDLFIRNNVAGAGLTFGLFAR
jgi:hypothetical protein